MTPSRTPTATRMPGVRVRARENGPDAQVEDLAADTDGKPPSEFPSRIRKTRRPYALVTTLLAAQWLFLVVPSAVGLPARGPLRTPERSLQHEAPTAWEPVESVGHVIGGMEADLAETKSTVKQRRALVLDQIRAGRFESQAKKRDAAAEKDLLAKETSALDRLTASVGAGHISVCQENVEPRRRRPDENGRIGSHPKTMVVGCWGLYVTEIAMAVEKTKHNPGGSFDFSGFTKLERLSFGDVFSGGKTPSPNLGGKSDGPIPATLCKLSNLKRLEIQSTRWNNVPACVGRMEGLTEVKIFMPHIKDLPAELFSLPNLRLLQIDKAQLKKLPDLAPGATVSPFRIFILSSQPKLESVPDWMCDQPFLWRLSLVKNGLTKLPDCFFSKMPRLELLRLSQNKLAELPEAFGSASRLYDVYLNTNRLTAIPDSVGRLKLLQRLDVAGNFLKSLPDTIGDVSKLRKLWLSSNHLTTLPTSMGNLSKLRDLQLSFNLLTSLPASFSNLFSMEHLYLHSNSLTSFPKPLLSMAGLQYLEIDHDVVSTMAMDSVGVAAIHTWTQRSQLAEDLNAMRNVSSGIKLDWELTSGNAMNKRTKDRDPILGLRTCETYVLNVRNPDGTTHIAPRLYADKCTCSPGYFQKSPTECRQCPNAYTKCHEGLLTCEDGFFRADAQRMESNSDYCHQCPEGSVCDRALGDMPVPLAGFWKESATDHFVRKCPNPNACLGGNVTASKVACEEGYQGPLCKSCSSGYFSPSESECERCPPLVISYFWAFVIFVTLALVIAFLLVMTTAIQADLNRRTRSTQSFAKSGSSFSLTKLNIVVGFAQILVNMRLNYTIEWPEFFKHLDYFLKWMNFDFFRSSSIECLFEGHIDSGTSDVRFDYYFQLIAIVITPIALTLAMVLLYYSALAYVTIYKHTVWLDIVGLRSATTRITVILWLFSYLPMSTKAFGTFSCEQFYGTYYMTKDLQTECYTARWWYFSGLAIAVIVFMSIGFPILLLVYIVTHRQDLGKLETSTSLGVIYGVYKRKYAYWESLEMFRKILVGVAITFITDRPEFQITMAMMVCFTFIVLHLLARPFKASLNNNLQTTVLVLLFFTLAASLLKSLNTPDPQASIMIYTIVALDLLVVALSTLHFYFFFKKLSVTYRAVIGQLRNLFHNVVERKGRRT